VAQPTHEQREQERQRAFARGETLMERLPTEGLSPQVLHRATIAKLRELAPQLSGEYLDVGSGNGELIDQVMRTFPVNVRACDYRDDLMTLRGVAVDVVDLNTGTLPYADETFDAVTCTEVIEHLEDFRRALREISRVTKPGGVFVLSTPNVLNLRSRLRYLFFGFYNLFGPLRLDDDRQHSTYGHINPVSYFYVAHALHNSGLTDISVSVDKLQRRSWPALALLWLPIRVFTFFAMRKERGAKLQTLDAANEPFVRAMNRLDVLLGRTIVVGCRKAATPRVRRDTASTVHR
jgi:SAM-dependent methyltransferase